YSTPATLASVSIWVINFLVSLAMKPTEMGVFLKQRQDVSCCARWLDVGNVTAVGNSTALLRAELELH
ncbi:hypothetical protein KGF42_19100, partial [Clostridioides sp. ZZV15-6383]|nr:hypothetical protein [Clostridioides sp. ZZV15-6383]